MLPLLFGLAGIYAVLILLSAVALARTPRVPQGAPLPRVSVIIAARNEEAALPACLASLSRLTYPADLLEIVIADDGSTDATAEILAAAAARMPGLHGVAPAETHGAHGKVAALERGIAVSTGEILMFTDADCRVPPAWIEQTVRWYDADDVGLVAGFTLLEGRGLFARVQQVDWLFLFSVAAAAVRLNFPVTAVGNNLSVKRSAYASTGGYSAIPFSVTEDFALFTAIVARGWRVRFPLAGADPVLSDACTTAGRLVAQKRRWFLGGAGMRGMRRVLFLVAYLFMALTVIAAVAGEPAAAAIAMAVKTLADGCLLFPAVRAFRLRDPLPILPLYEVFAFLTTLLFPPLVLARPTVVWKDRSLRNAEAPR
jgi:1,2-diacylglycerol 3-beta-glucosyltransferase